jgi:tRNA threonylcarbamoyl adenosine modification protein YeaZ
VLVLALDTATASVVVGVVETGTPGKGWNTLGVRAAVAVSSANRHAETLGQLIPDVLGEAGVGMADLTGVVVGLGPGPFTGLRVGVITAAALGDALGVPVYGVCTHDAMAAMHMALVGSVPSGTTEPDEGLLVVTDARRRECYWADYDASGTRISGPHVQRPADLVAARGWPGNSGGPPAALVIGDPAFSEPLGVEVVPASPDPIGLVLASPRLATGQPPTPLKPLYLRRPDATPPAPRKLVTPA